MLENLLTVAGQVLMLFIIIAVGFVCGKTKLVKESAAKSLSNIVLYVATPSAILQAFTGVDRTPERNRNLIFVFLLTLLIHVVMIVLARLLTFEKEDKANRVMQFAVIFSNCGYMSFPLQKAILGDEGVFYGAMFVAVFNIVLWSYGALLASGDKKSLSIKNILINPTIISVIVSVILYIFSIKLPSFLSSAVTSLGNLNTPLPMLIIGLNLSTFPLLQMFTDKRVYLPTALRILILPAISLGLLFVLGIRGIPLIACTVAASAPTAAATVMFATKYDLEATLASKIASLTTILSIITMPIFVMLAQAI